MVLRPASYRASAGPPEPWARSGVDGRSNVGTHRAGRPRPLRRLPEPPRGVDDAAASRQHERACPRAAVAVVQSRSAFAEPAGFPSEGRVDRGHHREPRPGRLERRPALARPQRPREPRSAVSGVGGRPGHVGRVHFVADPDSPPRTTRVEPRRPTGGGLPRQSTAPKSGPETRTPGEAPLRPTPASHVRSREPTSTGSSSRTG